MIKQVQLYNNNKELVKSIPFESGLNIIIAEIADTEVVKDNKSRNGTGKSSLLEIIDFCLGGDPSTIDKAALKGWEYSLTLELGNETYVVTRCIDTSKKVYIQGGDFSQWTIQPNKIKDSNLYYVDINNWKLLLGTIFFGMNQEENNLKYYPSFRSIIPFFIRHNTGAYEDPFCTFKNLKAGQIKIANTFLLGLNWKYAIQYQLLADKKKVIDNLKKANKEGYLDEYLGKKNELKAKKNSLEKSIEKLQREITTFQVHEEYYHIQKETDNLTSQIHDINNTVLYKERLLKKYEEIVLQEKDTDFSKIQVLYNEAGLIFSEEITKSLAEVVDFHKKIIANRQEYLKDEINKLKYGIVSDNYDIERLSNLRAQNLKILETHNALDEYNKLVKRSTKKQQELNEVVSNLEKIQKIDQFSKDYKNKVDRLVASAGIDMFERKVQIDFLNKKFYEIAKLLYEDVSNESSLYSKICSLTIDFDKSGYKFDAVIGGDNSTGRKTMKIFDYDMTVMNLRSKFDNKTNWLIHDSDIFDSVDLRQIAIALNYAYECTNNLKTQYICTINSDKVPHQYFDEQFKKIFENSIRLKLTDTDKGGLFGFKFN